MSANPPRPDPGNTTDRVRCAYCGGNNFPTSPTCWQCGRPLRPLSVNAPASAMPGPAPSAAPGPLPAGSLPPVSWSPSANVGLSGDVNPSLAPKAAAALGMLFPWAALPVGIVFLMLDDSRKAKLGWICIAWSVGGTILNLLLFVLTLIGLLPELKTMIPHGGLPGGLPGGAGGTGSAGGGLSIPSLGGG